MSDVTHLLGRIEVGDPSAADQLLPLVYHELKQLAAARMKNERADHTLQATALVHEAYVRLVDVEAGEHWNSRRHFFAAAAEAMRRILIEQARRKSRLKHGGLWNRISLDHINLAKDQQATDLLALNDALDRLAEEDPTACEIVKLRYFAGFTIEQAADALGISIRTANRQWSYAKAWLFDQLHS